MKYICENCDNVVVDKTVIKKCVECGHEICVQCAEGSRCYECAKGEPIDCTYPNGFYKFGKSDGAVKVPDDEIKHWLKTIKNQLLRSNEKYDYSCYSGGDTYVIGFKLEGEMQFIVAKNYEELTVFEEEVEFSDIEF